MAFAPVDAATGIAASVSNGGEQVVTDRQRLAGGVLATTLSPWYVDKSTGGGSIELIDGFAKLHSGPVGGRAILESAHRARVVLPQTNHCTVVIRLNGLDGGMRCRWGVFDDNDGFFFEVIGTSGWVCSRKAGVDTRVPSTQLSGLGSEAFVVNTNRHSYTVRYLVTLAYFTQDRGLIHRMASSTTGPLVLNPDLPVRVECENLSNGADHAMEASVLSISRLGPFVDAGAASFNTVSVSTASTLVLPANPMRRLAVITNDSGAVVYPKFGSGASTSSFTYRMAPNTEREIRGFEYSGPIYCARGSGTSNVYATETTEI